MGLELHGPAWAWILAGAYATAGTAITALGIAAAAARARDRLRASRQMRQLRRDLEEGWAVADLDPGPSNR